MAETATPHLAYRVHAGSISATRQMQMCATHLKILEENLVSHYPAAAGTGMAGLVMHLDPERVDAAADMIRRLDALSPDQPESERAAFNSGLLNTVHFVFALLCKAHRYDLAHRFIEGAQRWQSVRRRERAVLSTPAAHIGITLSEWHVDLKRRLGSRLLSESLPGYVDILTCATVIERASGLNRAHHAA